MQFNVTIYRFYINIIILYILYTSMQAGAGTRAAVTCWPKSDPECTVVRARSSGSENAYMLAAFPLESDVSLWLVGPPWPSCQILLPQRGKREQLALRESEHAIAHSRLAPTVQSCWISRRPAPAFHANAIAHLIAPDTYSTLRRPCTQQSNGNGNGNA